MLEALHLVADASRLLDKGNPQKAESTWLRAVQIDPRCSLGWMALTEFYESEKRVQDGLRALSRWMATSERTAQTLFNQGSKSCALHNYEQGKPLLLEALQMDASLKIPVEEALAKVDCLQKNWEQAILRCNEILKANPDNLEALRVRFSCWNAISFVPEEVADHRHLLRVKPDVERHSRLLFMLNYLAQTTPEQIYEESVQWSKLYADPLAAEILPHSNRPDPERRLKVAYLSPDLYTHAIMKLLPVVFEKHDHENFEVFAYSLSHRQDEFTEYVQQKFENRFVELPLCRKTIADRVRSDGIDILVDLAGHTMHTDAYLAFATKPAPVQVSWLGVLSTTGLKTMDYFLGDAYIPCPGTEHLFTEKAYRLPRAGCAYRPPGDPGVSDPPCIKNGYITFGCYNAPRKVTVEVAKVWSIILHLNPGSKLHFKYHALDQEIAQRRIRGWFADYGIPMDRLMFEGDSPPLVYLARYGEIDISLDPFPYHGGTTTLDALWMGVPVVSLSGRLTVSCSGVSNLTALGLPVAKTIEEYVAQANQLARDMPHTPNMRREIRARMLQSDLLDEQGLVRALETAYREMWRTWCAQRS